jgi:hypothetical protein
LLLGSSRFSMESRPIIMVWISRPSALFIQRKGELLQSIRVNRSDIHPRRLFHSDNTDHCWIWGCQRSD